MEKLKRHGLFTMKADEMEIAVMSRIAGGHNQKHRAKRDANQRAKRLLTLAAASSLAGLSPLLSDSAQAANVTWLGTTSSVWQLNSNWSANFPATGDTATFNGAGNGNTTIDVGTGLIVKNITFTTSTAAAYTIGTGGAGSETFSLNAAGAVTINGNVSSNINETINANLILDSANGNNSFTFTDSASPNTLIFAGNISSGTNTGNKTLTVNGTGDTAISGAITNGSGIVALTKAGNGNLTLSHANTYSGATTVNAGLFAISGSGTLGNGTSALGMGGGTLDLGATSQTVGAVTITAGGGTIQNGNLTGTSYAASNTAANSAFITANLLGSGIALTRSGNGTLTLSGADSYTGGTNILAGTVQFATTSAMPASGTVAASSGATLAVNAGGAGQFTDGSGTSTAGTIGGLLVGLVGGQGAPVTFASGSSLGIDTTNGNVTYSTAISNSGLGLTKLGTGTLTLSGNITTGVGAVTVNAGTLNLTGSNTYTGGTNISAGTLQFATTSAMPASGTVAVNSGATLAVNAGGAGQFTDGSGTSTAGTIGGLLVGLVGGQGAPVTFASGSSLGIDTTNGNLTYSTAISNSGLGLTKLGTGTLALSGNIATGVGTVTVSGGTLTLSGTNTYSGNTNLSGGTLAINSASALGNGTLLFSSGTIDNTSGGAISVANSITTPTPSTANISFSTSGGTGNNSLSFAGPMSLNNNLILTLNGTGNLTFGGLVTNTRNGFIQVTVNNGAGTGNTSAVTFGGFALSNNSNSRIDTFAGNGALNITGAVTNGPSSTASGLIYSGTGTLTLTGNSTYGGATSVSSGTLALGNGGVLGNTALTVSSGATFASRPGVNGANTALGGTLTLNAGSILSMADGNTATLSVTGNGSLAPGSGSATSLVFDVGGTTTAVDTLTIGGAASIGLGGTVITLNGIGSTAPVSGNYTLISGNASSSLASNATLASSTLLIGSTNYAVSLVDTATAVVLHIGGSLGLGAAYWTGAQGANWSTTSGNNTNWNTSATSGTDALAQPTGSTDVFFTTSSPTAINLTNTVDTPYSINSLNFTASAGNVTINGSSALTIMGGNTTNVAAPGITVAGGAGVETVNAPIVLGGNLTFTNNSANTLTIGGNVSGGFALNIAGSGPIALAGSNSYTGGTTLSTGTLQINNASALGNATGTFAINGGTIDNTSGGAISVTNTNPITLGGNFSYSTSAGNATSNLSLAGAVSNSGNDTLTLNGGGNLTFSGVMTNTLAGNNTLTVNNGAGANSASAVTFGGYALSNSAINYTDIITGNGAVNITGAVTNGPSSTASGLTYSGTGTLSISGNSTYTGPTTLSGAGVLSLTGTLGTGSGTAITVSNASANFNESTAGAITGNSSFTLTTGTATLAGSNTYSGATTLTAGTLTFQGFNSLPSSSPISLGTATLTLRILDGGSGNNTTISHTGNNITLTGSTTVDTINVDNNGSGNTGNTIALGVLSTGTTAQAFNDTINFTGGNGTLLSFSSFLLPGANGATTFLKPTTTSVTITGNVSNQMTGNTGFDTLHLAGSSIGNFINGVIADSSAVAGSTRVTLDAGSEAWTLAGNSTYQGATTINGGTLNITGKLGANSGGTGTAITENSTTANFNESTTGVIAGTSSFTLTNGAATLAGANTYSGNTTLTAGTLAINNAAALGNGTGTFAINGGTIDNTSGGAISVTNTNPITLGGNFSYSTSAGNATSNLSLAGAVSNSGNRTITLNGGGILNFRGVMTNTLAGNNTLTVNNGAGTGVASAVTFGGYALSNSGINYTNIITGNGAVNITGSITDGGSATASGLTYNGTGTLTLTGTSTFHGGTTIGAGTLSATGTALSTGPVTLSGGIIAVNSGNGTTAQTLTTGNQTWKGSSGYTARIFSDGTADFMNIGAGGNTTLTIDSSVATSNPFTVLATSNAASITTGSTYDWVIAGNITTLSGVTAPTVGNATVLAVADAGPSSSGFALNVDPSLFTSGYGSSTPILELEQMSVSGPYSLDISYNAAPEPGTGLLVLAGLGSALLARRRRRNERGEQKN